MSLGTWAQHSLALQAPTEAAEKGAPIGTCPLWNSPPGGGGSIQVELGRDPSWSRDCCTGEASGLAGTRRTPEEGAREKEPAKLCLLGTALPAAAASPWLGAGIPGVSLQAEHEGCSSHPTLVGKAGCAAARPRRLQGAAGGSLTPQTPTQPRRRS